MNGVIFLVRYIPYFSSHNPPYLSVRGEPVEPWTARPSTDSGLTGFILHHSIFDTIQTDV